MPSRPIERRKSRHCGALTKLSAVLAAQLLLAVFGHAQALGAKKQGSAGSIQSRAPAALPSEIAQLGPLSVGHPAEGFLVNAVSMPRSRRWVVSMPEHGFATRETIDGLVHCIDSVAARFPNTPAVVLGSLSAREGGRIAPHKSHRTGRDADVYFYRQPGAQWSRAATLEDIDLPRTWALLRCFITDTDVDMILLDERVQGWLERYALDAGEPEAWVRSLFNDLPSEPAAVVRHEPGHVAHFHVRFTSPEARRAAARAYERLVKLGVVAPEYKKLEHVVQSGETLSHIARAYKLSLAELRALNNLRGHLIRKGQKLTVRQPVAVKGVAQPVHVPARRLPPAPAVKPPFAAEARR